MNQYNFCSYRSYQSMIAISKAVYNAKLEEAPRAAINGALFEYNSDDFKARVRYLVEHNDTLTSVLALLPTLSQEDDKALIDNTLNNLSAAHPGYAPIQNIKTTSQKPKPNASVSTTVIPHRHSPIRKSTARCSRSPTSKGKSCWWISGLLGAVLVGKKSSTSKILRRVQRQRC